jgi:putative nucleotidyltransferase with HDIG domain
LEFPAGEIVVQRGTVIDESDLEALTRLGFVEEGHLGGLSSALALIAVLGGFVALYFMRRRPAVARPRNLLLIAIIFIVFLVGAWLAILTGLWYRTSTPCPRLPDHCRPVRWKHLWCFPFHWRCLRHMGSSPATTWCSSTPAILCGTLALVPARRVSNFVRAGVVIALTGIGVVVAYRVPFTPWDWTGLATLAAAALFNAGASASVALLVQFFLAQAIGLTTPMHLLEVSRSDHPLLQAVLRGVPGTYQHSLNVANLAEPAADAIGADSLLVRVGALYHDCGKSVNPQFFIENQPPDNLDPHDGMDPLEAARLVIKHIPDGLALARKYRLPPRVRDFISEHHGTLITRYQYTRALELAGGDATQVDIERFRYPGPPPRSRETAILMLSDMTEARVRAERPEDEDALRAAIQQTIEICQKNGQLDDTSLTLRDLHQITESFTSSLQGSYHPRIAYPAGESAAVAEETPGDSHRD